MVFKACQGFHRIAEGLGCIAIEDQSLLEGGQQIEIIIDNGISGGAPLASLMAVPLGFSFFLASVLWNID
jgi:hypothetical protein